MSSKRTTGGVLYRVMLTHLLVAIPPAVVVGFLVVDVNRRALLTEVQNVHLAVGARLGDAIALRVQEQSGRLLEAERIIAAPELSLERKKALVGAMIAARSIPYLALHRPDGQFDSAFATKDGASPLRETIPSDVRLEARERGFAVGNAIFGDDGVRVPLLVPWYDADELVGWVVTELALDEIARQAELQREQFLGTTGRLDVVDGEKRYLTGSLGATPGQAAGEDTPFTGIAKGTLRRGMSELEAGMSQTFVDASGDRWLGTVTSVPIARWMIGSARLERVALESIAAARRRSLLVAIAAALAAGIVALILARRISDPIHALTAAVRKSASAGFFSRIDVPAFGELDELRIAYNEALTELDRNRTELRDNVRARLRMARFVPPPVLHQMLSSELDLAARGIEEELTIFYAEVRARSGDVLSDSFNREQLVHLLSDIFGATCTVVQDHGGRIDYYSGDAVIGVFVGPLQERAVEAVEAALRALESAETLRRERRYGANDTIRVAIGIASGRGIIARAPGGPREVSVVGEIVMRAAELLGQATEGAIAIDTVTHKATAGRTSGAGKWEEARLQSGQGPIYRWEAGKA